MGWKSLKEEYDIKHIVQVRNGNIIIGSSLWSDIIEISPEGKILKAYSPGSNEQLLRYMAEFEADPEKLRRIVRQSDTFSQSITVYTYKDGEIIEKLCEEPGWPNITHDGDIQYENTFSTDKNKVISWAKENLQSIIRFRGESIEDLKDRIKREEDRIQEAKDHLQKLSDQYPDFKAIEKGCQ